MHRNANHWLLRPSCDPMSAGSSVSGAAPRQPAPRVLDHFFIRSHFDDAPDEALGAAAAAIADIQRERKVKQI